ncbi:hypothetical protein BY996DRAFT_6414749 [Phakopsora pachyrhizi]|nr:hypothetical protein BY996DRAFT_6414749 [Phakopsora pachyrhizi]
MSAHSAAATNSRIYLPTNFSAALKFLKPSESAVGLQANIANSVFSESQRATKSVGIATPTYHANLLATRAKKWDISDENGFTVFTTNSGAQNSGERHLTLEKWLETEILLFLMGKVKNVQEKLLSSSAEPHALASFIYNSCCQTSKSKAHAAKSISIGLTTSGPNWEDRKELLKLIKNPQSQWSHRIRLRD